MTYARKGDYVFMLPTEINPKGLVAVAARPLQVDAVPAIQPERTLTWGSETDARAARSLTQRTVGLRLSSFLSLASPTLFLSLAMSSLASSVLS